MTSMGISSIGDLRDMTNAFGTTDPEIREMVLHLLVPPDAVVENGLGLPTTIPGYRSLFKQRVVNSIPDD